MRSCWANTTFGEALSLDSYLFTGTMPRCMPEETLFETEASQSRGEIASYLRRVADKLDAGDGITLKAKGQSVTMTPPSRPTFEVKAEREGPADQSGELSIEFEIEWDENGEGGGQGSGQLEIE